MARNVNTTIVPVITLHVLTRKKDESVVEKLINIEDMVENLRYAGDGKNNKITGRIADIAFKVAKTKRLYTSVTKAKSWFKYDVTPTDIFVDASTEYHSNVKEIPVRELLEDIGVTDVKMITSYLSYGLHGEVLRSDETTNTFDIREGDILTDIRYLFRGDETVLPSAKLIAIKRDGTTLKPVSLVLNLDNKLRVIQVEQLVSIGGAGQPIDETKSIVDAIDPDTTEPQVIYVGPGTFSKRLEISNDVTIKGNKVGIWGTSKNRDPNVIDDETVISGAIVAKKGAKLEIDGCVLTKNAIITLASCNELTIRNCIIKGLVGTNNLSAFIDGVSDETGVKLVVERCYFAENVCTEASKIYNLVNIGFPLRNGSSISGNYFAKNANTHNFINVYNIMNGAIININDNEFEYSATAIRVGTIGDVECTININNLKYDSTDESEDGKWAGMMLIQPYRGDTISMKDVKININNVKKKDTCQLYFMYSIVKDGYTVLTEENAPVVRVNGKEYPRLFNHIQGSDVVTPTPTPVDKTALDNLIKSIDEFMTTTDKIFTYESMLNLTNVTDASDRLLKRDDVTQIEVDAQVTVLQAAFDGLVEVTSNHLLELITEANANITENVYTIDSENIVKKSIADAQEIVSNTDATQEDVNRAYVNLQESIRALKLIDNNILTSVIDTANEKLTQTEVVYTDESKNILQIAITSAQVIVDNADATQENRDQVYVALINAINGLTVKEEEPDPTPVGVNKDALTALIATANEKMIQTDITYTDESLATLRVAISNALAVVNNENATQNEVDAEVSALQSAINSLVVKEEEPDPVVVNKESLINLIATATSKLTQTEVEYTDESKASLQAAITAAQNTVNNTDATQEEVNSQAAVLQIAIDALVVKEPEIPDVPDPVVVDKSALTTLITSAIEKLTDTEVEYTEDSKSALQNAVTAAQAIINNADATQGEVDAGVTILQTAIDGLVVKEKDPEPVVVNRDALVAIIALANEKLAQTDVEYTDTTKAALMAAITTAQSVLNDENATQEEVDAEVATVQSSIDGLMVKEPEPTPIVVDKSALITLIATANESLVQTEIVYTDKSKEALQNAITTAQAVVDNEESTQEEIDAQVTALQSAIDGLTVKEEPDPEPVVVDKDELVSLIATATEKLTQTEVTYTDETREALQTAINAAQTIVDSEESTQDEVDAQITALQGAIDALVVKQPEIPDVPDPVVVNKDELVSLIATANEKANDTSVEYTEESKGILLDAITAAQAVVDNEEATQEEVNAQLIALQESIDGLVEVTE